LSSPWAIAGLPIPTEALLAALAVAVVADVHHGMRRCWRGRWIAWRNGRRSSDRRALAKRGLAAGTPRVPGHRLGQGRPRAAPLQAVWEFRRGSAPTRPIGGLPKLTKALLSVLAGALGRIPMIGRCRYESFWRCGCLATIGPTSERQTRNRRAGGRTAASIASPRASGHALRQTVAQGSRDRS
jgi:hypothetical protein